MPNSSQMTAGYEEFRVPAMARKRLVDILCRSKDLARENGDFFNRDCHLLRVLIGRFDAQKSPGASSGASFCKVRRAGFSSAPTNRTPFMNWSMTTMRSYG